MTTKTKAKDMTGKLPKRIIWRDALRVLEVGDFFEASQLDYRNVANSFSYLRENEDLNFTTASVSRETFVCIRITPSMSDFEVEKLKKNILAGIKAKKEKK